MRQRPLRPLLLAALLLGAVCVCARNPPDSFTTAPGPLEEETVERITDERAILLKFRDGITNWAEVKAARGYVGWEECAMDSGAGCQTLCSWSGVVCGGSDDGSVVELDLSCQHNACAAKLRGTVYPGLAWLGGLLKLNLGHNELGGRLPALWGRNGTWLSLVELDIHSNMLTGPIPDTWGTEPAFNALFNMHLANNQLSGTIPETFWTSDVFFKELMSLNLAANRFEGTLPLYINGLITQDLLSLANNRFTGPLPPGWGSQAFEFVGQETNATQALAVLRLNGNQLTGTLPVEWAAPDSFSALRSLTLDGNRLSGGLPDAWRALPAITDLNLSGSGLGGQLPAWGPDPATLQSIDLSGCNFSGSIPASWAELGELHQMAVQPGNQLLCPLVPNAAFQTCADDPLCDSSKLDTSACGTQPDDGSSGGSSFPVAAVAVPCAVLGAAALAGAAFWWHRRRHSRPAAAGGSLKSSTSHVKDQAWLDARAAAQDPGGAANGSSNGSPPPEPDLDLEALPSDWAMHPSELEYLRRPDGNPWQLGSGGFGTVFKALRNGVQPVAVKVLSASTPAAGRMGETGFQREIAILRACRDANILQFVGAFVQQDEASGEGQLCLVTEFMEGGSLQANIRQGRVSWWKHGQRIATDLARALAFLHSRRLVHLDVKSSNVLLSRDGTAKLGDLGMARLLSDNYVTGVVGTLAWSAPEMLLGQRCSEKADVYSFGIVLWEICTTELPARGQMRDPRLDECPAEVDAIINRCLAVQASARPSAVELVQMLERVPGRPLRAPSGNGRPPFPPPPFPAAVPLGGFSPASTSPARSQQQQQQQGGAAGLEEALPQASSDLISWPSSTAPAAPGSGSPAGPPPPVLGGGSAAAEAGVSSPFGTPVK